MRSRTSTRPATGREASATMLVVLLATGLGCDDALEVEGLSVTTKTGTQSSDQNIFFCFTRLDRFEQACVNLETEANDFQAGATDYFAFQVGEPIVVDDAGGLPAVADIAFDNRGGSQTDGWTMVGFRIEAILDDGTTSPVCSETAVEVSLYEGDLYVPPPCP